jgi:hypothetical protein
MDFLQGYLVNAIATATCHPIDVVKTTYQTTNYTITNSVKKVINERLFFRGLSPNLGTYPIFWGIYFQTKSLIQSDNTNLFNNFLISYVSGNTASLIANPLFTMKVQMQTSKYGYFQTLKTIGVSGLYSGFAATSVNNLKLGIQFPMYEYLKIYGIGIGASAFIAKGLSTSIMYPMDLVRVQQRKQLNRDSIIAVLKRIYTTQGFRGFYRGLLLYNCVSTSQFVIMMYGMEWLKHK